MKWVRLWDKGAKVRIIQQKLKTLGFYSAKVDGDFGAITEHAVMKFQYHMKLNADGVIGPITRKAMGLESLVPNSPAVAPPVPNGIDQIIETFGDPLDPGYWEEYGGFYATPPELIHAFPYTFEGKNGFWCNKLVIPAFQKVYSNIVKRDLTQELHSFDGCYSVRYTRGSKNMSTHAWGIAVDHDAKTNPLGADPKMNFGVIECFEKQGFQWGGRWKRKDGMHFQYAQRY